MTRERNNINSKLEIIEDIMIDLNDILCKHGNHIYEHFKEGETQEPEPQECEPQESEDDKGKLWWLGKNCKDCGNEKCKKLGTLPKGHDCALWQQ